MAKMVCLYMEWQRKVRLSIREKGCSGKLSRANHTVKMKMAIQASEIGR